MEQQEFDIEIKKDGEVKVHIKGVKGAKCMEYAKLFESIVGPIKGEELTSEYYEPESQIGINISG